MFYRPFCNNGYRKGLWRLQLLCSGRVGAVVKPMPPNHEVTDSGIPGLVDLLSDPVNVHSAKVHSTFHPSEAGKISTSIHKPL